MTSNKVINIDEKSEEFLSELKRRIKIAKNPKSRIPFIKTKKDILKKYQELIVGKI